MKKYVIGHEEQCLVICKSRADAEEMILSIAEENIYENWFEDSCSNLWWSNHPYKSPFEFIANNGKNKPNENMSDWAWALYSFSSAYWIDEVEEIE